MVRSFSVRRRPLRLSRRVLRIAPTSALILALPVLLLMAWYGWSSYVRYERYRRSTKAEVKLDAELFQLFLHDELTRHLRRLTLPEGPGTLDTFELSVDAGGMQTLADDATSKKKRRYVTGYLRKDGVMHEVDVRHQGRRHWHALGVQKSMKVRAKKGDLIDGVRVFNLINGPTPFGLEEQIILDLAREDGLLTPAFHPVRVRLNNADLGVYRFEAQPGEGLLRRQRRMPGSLYSGDFAHPEEPHAGFGKFGAATPDALTDFTEIDTLVAMVRERSHLELEAWASTNVDYDKFALFDALDVVFGGDQHDFESNVKLYYDSYRGRFEPIARDYRAFTHVPFYKLAENQMLLRFEALPDFLWRRDRRVYDLITGSASVPAIRTRVDEAFDRLMPELRADPYWDAYKLLGRASRFHRFMVRPMNVGRWVTATRAELDTFARRSRFLRDRLEARAIELAAVPSGETTTIEIVVDGYDAHRVREVGAPGDAGEMTVWADINVNGVLDAGDEAIGSGPSSGVRPEARDRLTAGISLVAVKDEDVAGPVRTVRVPRRYRYFVRASGGAPSPVSIELESLITGATTRRILTPTGTATITGAPADVNAVPKLAAGETTPHAWSFPRRPRPQTIVWAGETTVERSLFLPHETIEVRPGAVVRFANDTEIRGRLVVAGTAGANARLEGQRVTLRGPGTAGSRIERATLALAGLEIFDTEDIRLRDLEIRPPAEAAEPIHATYVNGLSVHEVTIVEAPGDAVDLEHTTADLRGLRVIGAGDECIDLMGADVRLTDSLLVGCKNNAVSAGEETNIQILGSAIADVKHGVLAKNASTARVSRTLIYRAKQALRTNRRDVHYDQPSRIDAEEVYAVECEKVVRRAKQTKVDARTDTSWPAANRLEHLRTQVLGVAKYEDLDARLRALRGAP